MDRKVVYERVCPKPEICPRTPAAWQTSHCLASPQPSGLQSLWQSNCWSCFAKAWQQRQTDKHSHNFASQIYLFNVWCANLVFFWNFYHIPIYIYLTFVLIHIIECWNFKIRFKKIIFLRKRLATAADRHTLLIMS